MRDDDCDGLFGVLGGVDADVGNEVAGFVDRFETFEGDVLWIVSELYTMDCT
jgi:hypothetical protein